MENSDYNALIYCSKYAYMPNFYGYCGPDKNRLLFEYVIHHQADGGLADIIKEFEVLYPYLEFISKSNKISNPFEEKVIEAYWLGNELLNNLTPLRFREFFDSKLKAKKKLEPLKYNKLIEKIYGGGFPFHNFHVFNVWKRFGNLPVAATLESMDKCRISWGKVNTVSSYKLQVSSNPLVIEDGKLKLGAFVEKEVLWKQQDQSFIKDIKPGNIVTIHWDWVCEVISKQQLQKLKYYTQKSLDFVNNEKLDFFE